MVTCWEVLVHLKRESRISAYAFGGFLLLSVDKFVQKKLTSHSLQCLPSCPLTSSSARLPHCLLHRHCLSQGRQESPSDLFFFTPFVDIFNALVDPYFPSWTSSLIHLVMCLLYFSPTLCLLRCLIKPVVSENEASPLLSASPAFVFFHTFLNSGSGNSTFQVSESCAPVCHGVTQHRESRHSWPFLSWLSAIQCVPLKSIYVYFKFSVIYLSFKKKNLFLPFLDKRQQSKQGLTFKWGVGM